MSLAAALWSAAGGSEAALDRLTITGADQVLPSPYDVTGLAAASIAAATLGIGEVEAVRRGRSRPVTIDPRAACAAFLSERLLTPIGWELPGLWDPIAGNYRTADGWIRLHTNYAYHRLAVLRVLGLQEADKAHVTAAVAKWTGDELETAVVAAGGCAAVMRSHAEWSCSDCASPWSGE